MSDLSDAEFSDTESKSSEHAKHSRHVDPEEDYAQVTVKDVLHAIRYLKEPDGATFSMVKNFLAADDKFAGVSAKRLETQVKLAMQKAIDEGKLSRIKRGLRFILNTLSSSRNYSPERCQKRGRKKTAARGKSRSRSKGRKRRKSRSRSRSRKRRHKSKKHR